MTLKNRAIKWCSLLFYQFLIIIKSDIVSGKKYYLNKSYLLGVVQY